jgi:hypothetical protein
MKDGHYAELIADIVTFWNILQRITKNVKESPSTYSHRQNINCASVEAVAMLCNDSSFNVHEFLP